MSNATLVSGGVAANGRLATLREPAESRVLLHGVSWETFENLLTELGDNRKARLAYDNGELEIMVPSAPHEYSNRRIEHLMMVLAREYGVDFVSFGSRTCKRHDLRKGIEPDSCFYIQHAEEVGPVIDLEKDPPPDLMIEIDMSTNSLNKLEICRELGVPEHWRFDGEKLEIRVLRRGAFIEVEESDAFPGIPLKDALPKFIEPGCGLNVKMADKFSAWIRAELKKSKTPAGSGKKRK